MTVVGSKIFDIRQVGIPFLPNRQKHSKEMTNKILTDRMKSCIM